LVIVKGTGTGNEKLLTGLETISAYTENTDKNVEALKKYPSRDTVPVVPKAGSTRLS
jgi:hypothetical protein